MKLTELISQEEVQNRLKPFDPVFKRVVMAMSELFQKHNRIRKYEFRFGPSELHIGVIRRHPFLDVNMYLTSTKGIYLSISLHQQGELDSPEVQELAHKLERIIVQLGDDVDVEKFAHRLSGDPGNPTVLHRYTVKLAS